MYQLIEIYLAWQEKLEQLNQPYYLKIWLADPEFMDSQIVAALGTEIDYYNNLFMQNEEPRDFPIDIRHPSIGKFVWERCVNGYYVLESDLETEKDINEVRKKAIRTNETMIEGRIERSYFMNTGDIWIGSISKKRQHHLTLYSRGGPTGVVPWSARGISRSKIRRTTLRT
ncbi:hypothetical protein [Paenibacillus sp. SN-8-1]|uniref:hypothetical protein n=1 Tax=Paenibacillus sp. SN-8-1 TaxID=3435409 RepID=UPI003D9A72F7